MLVRGTEINNSRVRITNSVIVQNLNTRSDGRDSIDVARHPVSLADQLDAGCTGAIGIKIVNDHRMNGLTTHAQYTTSDDHRFHGITKH